MACPTAFDMFRVRTEDLPDLLYLRASWRDIWLNLIPRDVWPHGAGLVRSSFTIGRSEPTSDTEEWPLIATATGSCATTYNAVETGFNEILYHPEQFGLSGPVICQDDLIWNFNAESFLEKYIMAIEKRNHRSISNRLANIYTHFVPKNIARADYPFVAGSTGDPPAAPVITAPIATSELTQEMLDTTAVELSEAGASDPNTNGWINLSDAGPVYPLYIGQLASKQVQLNNAELRNDYRFAYQGQDGEMNPVLKRMGANRIIGNFRHVINLFPPRYSYDGTKYVRVPTWTMPAGTKGSVAVLNPNWQSKTTAPYEGAWVLNPWVYTEELIKPVNSAAGLSWSPKSYFGEWEFVTGGKEITVTGDCFDPRKKLGRHFAEYKHAPKPIFPEFGRFIIFSRCPTTTFLTVSCS